MASFIPYIAYFQAELVPEPELDTERYTDFVGFEYLMLEAVAESLGVSLKVQNYHDGYHLSSR